MFGMMRRYDADCGNDAPHQDQTTKRSRFSEEQIIGILNEHEADVSEAKRLKRRLKRLLADGMDNAALNAGRRHDRFRALVCEAQMSPVRKHTAMPREEENRAIDRKVNSICRGR